MRVRVLRVRGNGGAVGSRGASLVPAPAPEVAQVVVRVRVLRVCGGGGAVGSLGASLVVALAQEEATVVVCVRELRVGGDGGGGDRQRTMSAQAMRALPPFTACTTIEWPVRSAAVSVASVTVTTRNPSEKV